MQKNNPARETILAPATPAGRGGIAVVRVSGPLVQSLMQQIVGKSLVPREATFTRFSAKDGETIDQGIAIYFAAPHSFTGEDVLECHCHGGPIVVDLLLQRFLELGARLARPGEFSERAFLNNKIDLTQAEAIADLIDSSSHQAAKLAIRSLQGEFSKAINQLTEMLIQLRMYIEAAMDFAEEEIDFLNNQALLDKMQDLLLKVKQIKSSAAQGSHFREGITAVIVGKPNVGKSSLLNCLSGKEIAIVTEIPGTTRDVLRDLILIDGLPIHIIDTAGLRKSEDPIEQEGIRRAQHEMTMADLLIYVIDASEDSYFVTEPIVDGQPDIIIRNKIDLIGEAVGVINEQGRTIVSLSVKNGAGIDVLRDIIKQKVIGKQPTEGIFLARRRHLDALEKAEKSIDCALQQLQKDRQGELAAEDLRVAQQSLSEITGVFTSDDLLGRIFSSFCIGK